MNCNRGGVLQEEKEFDLLSTGCSGENENDKAIYDSKEINKKQY